MKSKNERANSAGMKIKSNVKAGGAGYNHNQTIAEGESGDAGTKGTGSAGVASPEGPGDHAQASNADPQPGDQKQSRGWAYNHNQTVRSSSGLRV